MPSPDDWENNYWETNYTYATYSSSDLVSMGFIPEGTCEGTIVKLYKIPEKNSSGSITYAVAVYFSGNTVPSDWKFSGSIDPYLNNYIIGRLKAGKNGKHSYDTSGLSVG